MNVPTNAPVNAPVNSTANATVNATVNLNKTQKSIIGMIAENNRVTYNEMIEKIGVDRSNIYRAIKTLKEKCILERIGEDKNGYWKLNI